MMQITNSFYRQVNATLAIAARDYTKFLRDRARIVTTFIFPVIFIGILGSSLEANVGEAAGYSFLAFTFTGVLAQNVFQSTASGIISLVADRENDFAQELFISPISRYTIVAGKVIGEGAVALTQSIGIFLFAFVIGVEFGWNQILFVAPALVASSLLGGAFGVLVMANLKDQRSANQIFPLIIFPQFFLAGVFSPIKELPPLLLVLSRMSPMTYAVDLVRNAFYIGNPEGEFIVLHPVEVNLAVMAGLFVVMMMLGTWMFVRNERNK